MQPLCTMTRAAVAACVLALCLVSCSGTSGPTAPTASAPAPLLSGTWDGYTEELTMPVLGRTIGTVRTTLSQNGTDLSGTWTVTYANPTMAGSGTLSGSVSGTSVNMMLSPSVPTGCSLRVTATLTSPIAPPMFLQGTYASVSCTAASGGGVVLQKN